MSVFYPDFYFEKISDITPDLLLRNKISALILDVDNTLATHNNPLPDKDVLIWLETMKKAGIDLIIASNNNMRRISPFAAELSLECTANSMKPLPIGFLRASKRFNAAPGNIGVVGDQIFTDILGGNLFKAKTFLIKPLSPREALGIKLKRRIEKHILKKYFISRKDADRL